MALYAGYGSNLIPSRWRCGRPTPRCRRRVGWSAGLTFAGGDIGWEGSLATVVEDRQPRTRVFVVLYDVSDEDVHDGPLEGSELGAAPQAAGTHRNHRRTCFAWLYVVDGFEGGLPSARMLPRGSCPMQPRRPAPRRLRAVAASASGAQRRPWPGADADGIEL